MTAGPASLVADFQKRWRDGQRLPVEHYLELLSIPHEDCPALLDLIRVEVLMRSERGDKPTLEEYLDRFPPFADGLRGYFGKPDHLSATSNIDPNPRSVPMARPAAGDTMSMGTLVPQTTPDEVTPVVPPPPFDLASPAMFPAPPPGASVTPSLRQVGVYRVLDKLGEGGMGKVYLAEDTRLHRLVALKVLKPELACNEGERNRFLREAQATAALKSDHIVVIYQADLDQGMPFMAMELLQGISLQDWLNKGNRPSTDQILGMGIDIARGLALAHEHNLIHRDIKPGNLWLEQTSGRVKILDFGLVCHDLGQLGSLQSLSFVGTPGYMSPEQARAEAVDARCDVFSFGCVLYRLCTGENPFGGDSLMERLAALACKVPPPVRSINPSIPPALAQLVERMMAKQREDRPSSVTEVLAELETIAGVSGRKSFWEQEAPPAPPAEPAAPAGKGWVGRLGLIGVAVLVAVPLGYLLSRAFLPQEPRDTPPVVEHPPSTEPVGRGGKDRRSPPIDPRGPLDDLRREDIAAEDLQAMAGKDGVPPELVAVLGGTRLKHADVVLGLSYSPDGKRLASAGRDGRVVVWDAEDGHRLDTWELPGPAAAVAFAPNGRQLLAKVVDGEACAWMVYDLESRKASTLPLSAPSGMAAGRGQMAFSPVEGDGRVALVDAKGKIHVSGWKQGTGGPAFSPRDDGGEGKGVLVAFCPAGKYSGFLATWKAGEKKLRLWEPKGNRPRDLPLDVLPLGDLTLKGLAFDAKGLRLAACGEEKGDPKAWVLNLQTWGVEQVLDSPGGADSLAFSPDGALLAVGGWEEVHLWDVKGWKKRPSWTGVGCCEVRSLAFCPDGKVLAATGMDPAINLLSLPLPGEGKEPPLLPKHVRSGRAVLGLEGDQVLFAEDWGPGQLWKPGTPLEPASFRKPTLPVRVAAGQAGGRVIALGLEKPEEKSRMEVYEVGPPRRLCALDLDYRLAALTLSPDSCMVAASRHWESSRQAPRSAVSVWRCGEEKKVADMREGTEPIFALAFHPDGGQIAGAGEGKPSGRGCSIYVWDVQTGRKLKELAVPEATLIPGLVYSPDGCYLASTGCSLPKNGELYLVKGDVSLWDTETRKRTPLLQGHARGGEDLAFSPNGDRLAWSCQDGVIRIWTLPDKRLREIRLGPASCQTAGLAFSQDGRHLLAAYRNGTICILRLAEPDRPVAQQ